ncbi:MAG: c-di-GMP-binding flagellar brake protein YcgR [Oceanospirillaceae bacterium]|jgi:c-di-GMP-binding flagellar brake protein YcgR
MQSPRRKIGLELIGYIEGKSLLVTAPKKTMAFSASNIEGGVVKVHIMMQGKICTFMSRILKLMPEPYAYWHLAYPTNIEVSNIRKNARVSLKQPVSIEYQDTKLADQNEIPNLVYCTDISLKGLGVEAPVPLGEIGDEFFITLRLKVAGVDQMLLVSVILRSSKMSQAGVYQHGFIFSDQEDDSKVLIAAYVYKEILVNLGYVDERE